MDNWMAVRAVHRLVLHVVYVRQFSDALSRGSLAQLDPLFGLGQNFCEGRNNQRNFLNLLNTMAVGKDGRVKATSAEITTKWCWFWFTST